MLCSFSHPRGFAAGLRVSWKSPTLKWNLARSLLTIVQHSVGSRWLGISGGWLWRTGDSVEYKN